MNREETLALLPSKAEEAWNAWAQERLAERRAWAEDGTWPEGENPPTENADIERWCEQAAADFNDHTFETDVDFGGVIFPWRADFMKAEILVETRRLQASKVSHGECELRLSVSVLWRRGVRQCAFLK